MRAKVGKILINLGLACGLVFAALVSTGTGRGLADTSQAQSSIYLPLVHNLFTPSLYVVKRSQPAFDSCRLPSLQMMTKWWEASPYRTIGLYLGGPNFPKTANDFCTFDDVTPGWVAASAQIGWTFIPVWSGPQAPSFFNTLPDDPSRIIASDPNAAYLQGIAEANAAVGSARLLGFQNDLIIYTDIEAYRQKGPPESERQAVSAYVAGWVMRLHELGHKAGVYGSWRNTFMEDWAAIAHPPDDIWTAFWVADGYVPNVSVFDCRTIYTGYCVPPTMWPNHQRIYQYAGDVSETWGGLSLGIDVNVVDADIQGPGQEGVAGAQQYIAASSLIYSRQVADMGLVEPGKGWAIVDGRLLWTGDGGDSWNDISPEDLSANRLTTVDFADTQAGWVVAVSRETGDLLVWRTQDGGMSWVLSRLPQVEGMTGRPADQVKVSFVDRDHGWITENITRPILSQGILYRTDDGGETWQPLPLPTPGNVRFESPTVGWLVDIEDETPRFSTTDGGETWTAAILDDADAYSRSGVGRTLASLPDGTVDVSLAGTEMAWARTQAGTCEGDKVNGPWVCEQTSRLFSTNDNGMTWEEIIL